MALDFTSIKDQPGAALILIHDGSVIGSQNAEELAGRLRERVSKQIVILDVTSNDGRAIVEFYELDGTSFVLLIADDDELAASWTGEEEFNFDEIVYSANA